ncbi:hypothetical protein FHG87_004583, partial [Trinorchestia longiramus]
VIFHHKREEFFSSLSTDDEVVAFIIFLMTCVHNCELLLAPVPSHVPSRDLDAGHTAVSATPALLLDGHVLDHVTDDGLIAGDGDVEPPGMDLSPSQVMQVLPLLTVMKQLLSHTARHLSKDDRQASSRELLCKYLLIHPSKYSYSTVVYLIDIFNTCSVSGVQLCSPGSKCALLVDILLASSQDDSSRSSLLSIVSQWTREEWLISLCQILPTASPEDWRALANITSNIGPTEKDLTTPESKLRGLDLLSDALFLLVLQPRANVGFLCSNFTSAIIQIVKRHCEQTEVETQLEFLCCTFVWWCQRRRMLVLKNEGLSAQEVDEHSQLLLLRIVELLRDLMTVHSLSNTKQSEAKETEKVSDLVADYTSLSRVTTNRNTEMRDHGSRTNLNETKNLRFHFEPEAGYRMVVQSLLQYLKGDESSALIAAQLVSVFDRMS